jgi:RNA polymerase sigma-70 factor (ECF subfamily)
MGRLATTLPKQRTSAADKLVRAFNEVRAELVSTLFFMLGNYDDAQDAAQDAFLKCWRRRRGVKKIRNLRAWIFRVGLNAAKDLQRNAWRRRIRPLNQALPLDNRPGTSPAEVLVGRETLDRLRTALTDLRPEEKEVFLLRQNCDLTYDEIAALQSRPVGTVKTQMRSALHKLRRVLCERAPE